MSFVAVFMAMTTAFVLLAPIAMAAVLVTGTGAARRVAASVATSDSACGCSGACSCSAATGLRHAA